MIVAAGHPFVTIFLYKLPYIWPQSTSTAETKKIRENIGCKLMQSWMQLFKTALLHWETELKADHHTGMSFQSYADFVLDVKSVIFSHMRPDISVTMLLLSHT
jgi:hypothetical protein